jgi:rhomboid family GlyGly-CTERM serine protease
MKRLPKASLLLAIIAVVIYVLPNIATLFQYDRLAINEGEIWRLFSCHWTHFSANHLAWNVLTFVVLGVLCERQIPAYFYACVGLSTILIPLALWLILPDLISYRGLSGINSALFALLAITFLRKEIRKRYWIGIIVASIGCLAFVVKVGFEMTSGQTLFVHDRLFIPVPLAHGSGAVVGMAVSLNTLFAKDPSLDKSD